MVRLLGVDPGRVRIGLALSDEANGTMALPWRTVARGQSDREGARAVKRELAGAETTVGEVIVGLPLRLDGTEGEAARRARRFGDVLGDELGVPVTYWDERLTTVSAERGLRTLGVSGRKQKQVVDQAAAAILLQSCLDARVAQRTRSEEE